MSSENSNSTPPHSASSLSSLFSSSLSFDHRSSQLNSAKLSSLSSSSSYEEFSARVAAAHLKPLQKQDGTLDQMVKSPFFIQENQSDHKYNGIRQFPLSSSSSLSSSSLIPSAAVPRNLNEFNRVWSSLSSSSARYSYLFSVGLLCLIRLFRSGGGLDRLGELVDTLKDQLIHEPLIPQDVQFCFQLLFQLILLDQFSIHQSFLSEFERSNVQRILERLEEYERIPREKNNEEKFKEEERMEKQTNGRAEFHFEPLTLDAIERIRKKFK
jgi:hypothetical protein